MANVMGRSNASHLMMLQQVSNETFRITNGRPELYSVEQIQELEKKIANELKRHEEKMFAKRFNMKIFLAGSVLFFLLSFGAIGIQTYSVVVNDKSVAIYAGFV